MNELFSGWWFALLRLAANWRLMLVAALGVVVAATLLAVGPIYALSMSDLGLRHRLERGLAQPRDQVAYLEYGGLRIGDAVDVSRIDVMRQITRARSGWL
ncbi:MAG: hypothetical protein O2843_12290, partial [Chloroflexi bacterium]|nr:hypothetical protein [Chloroflexota bacterium]